MNKRLVVFLSHFVFFVNCAVPYKNEADISNGIPSFTDFLEKSLNKTVLAYNITGLSSVVPHFGGTLRLVNVKVVADNEFAENEVSMLVLKTSLQNATRRDHLMNFKECRFYTIVIPALKAFEETANISEEDRANVFPRCFGCRISLDPSSDVADSDYALLLENVKIQNFTNANSFTIDEIFIILKEMAKFHASFIALRRLQPQVFYPTRLLSMNALFLPNIDDELETMTKDLDLVPGLSSQTRDTVKNYLRPGVQFRNESFQFVETPYSTICHTDLRNANIMINKGVSTNDTTKIKFMDFQQHIYGSFVHDLLFFLFGNVSSDDILSNFTKIVKFYHAEFLKTIERYNCSSEDYTFDKIKGEIYGNAKFELFGLLYRSRIYIIDHHLPYETFFPEWKSMIDLFNKLGFFDS